MKIKKEETEGEGQRNGCRANETGCCECRGQIDEISFLMCLRCFDCYHIKCTALAKFDNEPELIYMFSTGQHEQNVYWTCQSCKKHRKSGADLLAPEWTRIAALKYQSYIEIIFSNIKKAKEFRDNKDTSASMGAMLKCKQEEIETLTIALNQSRNEYEMLKTTSEEIIHFCMDKLNPAELHDTETESSRSSLSHKSTHKQRYATMNVSHIDTGIESATTTTPRMYERKISDYTHQYEKTLTSTSSSPRFQQVVHKKKRKKRKKENDKQSRCDHMSKQTLINENINTHVPNKTVGEQLSDQTICSYVPLMRNGIDDRSFKTRIKVKNKSTEHPSHNGDSPQTPTEQDNISQVINHRQTENKLRENPPVKSAHYLENRDQQASSTFAELETLIDNMHTFFPSYTLKTRVRPPQQ